MITISDDVMRDLLNYEHELANQKKYCFFCERLLKNERFYKIYGDLICPDCLEERYGEEIE